LKKPLLLLFDGHALVHRAFHALPPLSVSKTGEPTGAVYGFVRMLLKTVQDLKPTHWAIAFDRPAPTFRHLEFEEYKAQRPEAPEDLRQQFGRVRQVVKAFNIPTFEMDGYEADDLLGTLARQAAAQGIETIIVSGDNDMLQLVSPEVKVLLPKRTFAETTLYDAAAVQEKLGVSPEQIPDFKGLKGDPSDNIPGVLGVGEKTAARLIQIYGSVEGIYEHIDEVTPPKLRETLLAEKGTAKRSKMLATIRTDAPVDFDPAQCQTTAVNRSELVPLFRELEFFSLANKLPELGEPAVAEAVAPPPSADAAREECVLVDTSSSLEELVARLSGTASFVIHLVTEPARPAGAAIAGIALCLPNERTYYLPVRQGVWDTAPQLDLQQTLERLRPVLSEARIAKLAHNGKEVITRLAEYNVELSNLEFDTMIAAYLLGQKSLELKDLAPSKLGVEMAPPAGEAGLLPVAEHACQQASIIGKLRPLLQREMDEKQLLRLFQEVEMPLVPVLVRIERNGMALDVDLLRRMSQSLGKQLVDLEQEIYSYAGHKFNINSPQQLGGVLFAELKLPGAKKTKTGYSTNASILEELREAYPIVKLILEYRQLSKLKSTYIDALPALINPATRRVHTSFNQTVTATGRLSSSEPNLQNIPIRGGLGRQIRQAFIAEPPRFLLSADYSQIDLRVLAHLSQDPRLLTAFKQDEDIHAATASEVFGVGMAEVTPEMRRTAKVVNFGVIYGMSGYGLEQATDLSREEAVQYIASYFQKYPKVKDYLERTKQQARENGFVQTLLGRRRYIPDLHSSNRQVREAAERMAINMPVQGTSADIIKVAMINLQREMDKCGLIGKMILQIHDELLFEVPPEELDQMAGLMAKTMSQAMELSVPLKVEVKVGRNWGDMELYPNHR
jgi:DNA polymerase-1